MTRKRPLKYGLEYTTLKIIYNAYTLSKQNKVAWI